MGIFFFVSVNIVIKLFVKFFFKKINIVINYWEYLAWGSKNLGLCIGLKSHILLTICPRRRNHGGAPYLIIEHVNVQGCWSERIILLGSDICQWSGLRLTLVHLPGSSSDEDRLQMYTEGIRTQKYLGKKLLPPH